MDPNGWIDVDKELPEDWQTVLAFWPGSDGSPDIQGDATYHGGKWYRRDAVNAKDCFKEPTHWKHFGPGPMAKVYNLDSHRGNHADTNASS
jgi:hypothetical protein